MQKIHIKSKLLGLLAIIGFSLVGLNSASAWGPERTLFTMDQPATYPTFNSITDNPSIGDERDFVRIGQINADVTNLSSDITVEPGHQYLVYIYYHNNASSTFNDKAHNFSGVAMGTRVASSFSTVVTPSQPGTVSATISSNNSNPPAVWDEAHMTTTSDEVLLHYVSGSAKIYNDWGVNGLVMPISMFSNEGALLGLNDFNGVIPGCEEYHGIITYVIQADDLNGSIEKSVSKDSTNFAKSVNLTPGEEATYKLTIRNRGNVALTHTVVKDQLPEGLSLVPGSVQMTDNDGAPQPLPDDIFTNGFNLGTIGVANTVYLTYKVVAGERTDCESVELTNLATLVYDGDTPDGVTKTASTTITVTKDGCTPPAENLEDCNTNPALPECTEPTPDEEETCATNPNLPGCQEMPNTGPVEIAIAAVVIAGIGGGGYYLYRTQRKLRTVEQGVMTGTGAGTSADKSGLKGKLKSSRLGKFSKHHPKKSSHSSTAHPESAPHHHPSEPTTPQK